MPTADPITTDRLAACVRNGATAQPALTAAARPVADRLAILVRRRLSDTIPADTGAVMLHIAAFYADVMTVLTEQGHPVADAVQIATSAIALAGVELYDIGQRTTDEQPQDERDAEIERLQRLLGIGVDRDQWDAIAEEEGARFEYEQTADTLVGYLAYRYEDIKAQRHILLREIEEAKAGAKAAPDERDVEDGSALARVLATLERHAARGSSGGEYEDADIRSILKGRMIWKTAAENASADLARQLQTFLGAFGEDPDDTVIENVGDRRLTVGMLRAAAAGLQQPTAQPADGKPDRQRDAAPAQPPTTPDHEEKLNWAGASIGFTEADLHGRDKRRAGPTCGYLPCTDPDHQPERDTSDRTEGSQ